MFKIIGQPINFRTIGSSKYLRNEVGLSDEARRIIKIAGFGIKHGYKAALEAFEVKKSTYYNYLQLFKLSKAQDKLLVVKSKRPHNIRQHNWDQRIINFICDMRIKHPNIGKQKLN